MRIVVIFVRPLYMYTRKYIYKKIKLSLNSTIMITLAHYIIYSKNLDGNIQCKKIYSK